MLSVTANFSSPDVLWMGNLGPLASCQEISPLHLCFNSKPSNLQQSKKWMHPHWCVLLLYAKYK